MHELLLAAGKRHALFHMQVSTFCKGMFLQATGVRLNVTLHCPALLLATCPWGSSELCSLCLAGTLSFFLCRNIARP